MQTKWLVKTAPKSSEIEELRETYGLDNIIAYMLLQRKISDQKSIKTFFRGNKSNLHDPFLMKNMTVAVERISTAIKNNEKVLIYGDYDVDGTTAVALVYQFLLPHLDVSYYIPDRYKEGYGVSKKGIEYAKEKEFSLIITLDCGIKAVEKVGLAKKMGIDVIICDHHKPGEQLPDAIVLDPKQKNCNYPYKGLSGCGVGFKLMSALCKTMQWDTKKLFKHLDLVAISIGADIVPLSGENRILAKLGLQLLNKKNGRPGIDALLKLAKREKPLTLTDVVFTIAPRINAAGRLNDAKLAVELMATEENDDVPTTNQPKSDEKARYIHQLNEERKTLDQKITKEALVLLAQNNKHTYTTVVYHPSWHKGVIGIVASRLIEQYYRPTIVLSTEDNKIWTGSARSIRDLNIYNIIAQCAPLLERFGGHAFAAGLTIKTEHLTAFQNEFEEKVSRVLKKEDLIPTQIIEKELLFNQIFQTGESIYEIPRIMRVLAQFEPFGPENMKPLFMAKNVYAKEIRLLKNEHLKMKVTQPEFNKYIDAIFFNSKTQSAIIENGPFDMVFTLEKNEFRGRTTPQIMVKDVRSHL